MKPFGACAVRSLLFIPNDDHLGCDEVPILMGSRACGFIH